MRFYDAVAVVARNGDSMRDSTLETIDRLASGRGPLETIDRLASHPFHAGPS